MTYKRSVLAENRLLLSGNAAVIGLTDGRKEIFMSSNSLRMFFGSALVMAMVVAIGCAPAAQAPAGSPRTGETTPGADQVNTKAPFPTKGEPKYGGVLTTAQTDDPPNFDLYSNSTTNMQKFIWAAYNNVVLFDPYDGGKIIPDVAEKWDISSDGKAVTFHLHKNIKFHDGTPLTAKDVKFSLEFMKDPPKGVVSVRRDNLEPIEKIETPDDYTVKVTLKRPYSALLPMLAQGWMGIYSKDFIAAKGNDIMKKEVMGSGAFKLKQYIRGTSVEMEKTPGHWQTGVPYVDGVQVFFIPDRGTRFAALRTGQLLTLGVDGTELGDVEKTLADKVYVERGTGISWSTVNFNVDRKPFDSAKVREAMSLAIDRRGYIKAIQDGDAQLGGYVPPSSPFALPAAEIEKLPGYGTDVEASRKRAKELLAQAGYPDGFESIQYVRKGSEDLAIYTQAEWKKIGINTTLKVLDSGPAYDALTTRDYDLFPWGHGLALDDPDAHYAELYLCKAPRNYSGVCDNKVEQLFLAQSTELDPEKRKQKVWELEKYAVPLNIKIVLSWNNYTIATWNQVKGFTRGSSSYNNTHYKHVWIDK